MSVLVIGNWLGLKTSKPDDKHVNANGEFPLRRFPRHSLEENKNGQSSGLNYQLVAVKNSMAEDFCRLAQELAQVGSNGSKNNLC